MSVAKCGATIDQPCGRAPDVASLIRATCYRLFDATTPGEPLLASADGTRWGWMVGVGLEYAVLGNWSAKIEYDYLGFGTQSITLVSVPGVTPPTRTFDVSQNISLVKAGINYRFGPMATPVVTK